METTCKATAKKLPEGMQVKIKSRNFEMLIDEPESLGGTDKYMSPIEVLLSALGGCQAIVVAAFAKAHKITYEDFYVDIEGDIDLDGFMGKSDARPGFQEVRYKMHFKTDEPREKMEKFVQFVEKSCPVGDSIEHAVKFVNSGIILE